ncbi:MAG: hypothetical protein CL583_17875 [Alteromonadaceae bacterium]|nr:hypothetical protein [Alteromonadaceae bacterium]|tara:strand:- start:29 stop:1006 length:978 start_codon:yes stop_codon:yes gene_type:complete
MTLRCGIIGAGQIAWGYDGGRWDGQHSLTHASCFDRHGDTDLVAVFDPIKASRDTFSTDYTGPSEVAVLDNLQDFLALDLDLVAIASPTRHHGDHLRACVDAGVARLWVEKPVTLELSEFEDLRAHIDAMQTPPRICVNYFRRALPQVTRLKAYVQSGVALTRGEVSYSRALTVNGVHLLDLLGHLFDVTTPPPLDWVRADASGANPDFGLTLAGVPITVTGHDLPYHLIELRLTGRDGRLALTQSGGALTWEAAQPNPDYPGFFHMAAPCPEMPFVTTQAAMRDGMFLMLDNLVDEQATPVSPLKSAYFAQSVLTLVADAGGLL